jgi:hypothetical protein
MAINSNFSIYEPEAWVEVFLANQFPSRPMVSQSVTNVAGADVEGLVASRNKAVNITRAVKTTTADVTDYTGNYTATTTPDADEFTLTMNKHKFIQFSIDKADQRFALPDLVEQHFVPRLHSLIDVINQDIKAEALKFEAAFADINGNATVIDDADLREARRILKARKLYNEGTIAVLSPDAEADLTGLNIFHQANERGDRDVQLSGNMGRAFGFDFFVDSLGSSHTAANVAASAVLDGAVAAGNTSVESNVAVTLSEGDVISLGDSPSTDDFYVVAADVSNATTITLKEAARQTYADGQAIDAVPLATSGTNEFFYDPKAISLVTAVMQSIDNGNGGVRRAAGFEPMNQVNYTLTVEETKSGADVLIEVLYGAKLFYPDLGVRYVRGTATKA